MRIANRAVFEHSVIFSEMRVGCLPVRALVPLAAKEKPYENDCAFVYRNHYFNVRDVDGIVSRRRIAAPDVFARALPTHHSVLNWHPTLLRRL